MKKLLIILGLIPSKMKKVATASIPYLQKVLDALESPAAMIITSIIPGDEDEALRQALIAVLSSFEEALKAVSTIEAKKALVARIGAGTLAKVDGNKYSITQYIIWFETVYAKTASKNLA